MPTSFRTLARAALAALGLLIPAAGGGQARAGARTDSAGADSARRVRAARFLVDSTAAGRRSTLVIVNGNEVDDLRTAQLRTGVAPGQSLLLRSASSLTRPLPDRRFAVTAIAPQFLAIDNDSLPFSQNNAALWAGRGTGTRTIAGFRLQVFRARLTFAPEMIFAANEPFPIVFDFGKPYPLPERPFVGDSSYIHPWYVGRFRIDQPARFGPEVATRFDWGQSTLSASVDRFELGVSNENEWWGPGIRNAIVLSNNAPGFPHLFARTARPLRTRLGDVDLRWIVGGLEESRYFDADSLNDVRSISAFAATLQTGWDPNLTIGAARAVYARATGPGGVPGRWLDFLSPVPRLDRSTPPDTTRPKDRRDHVYSVFARWVFPDDGFEAYAEWARTEWPHSLRDFLIAPNHSQGYTLGLQWARPAWRRGSVRIQGEATQLEQSATFRDRPVPSWYTSSRVPQGYTHRGQIIGAAIGPGASSQFVALDYLERAWRLGVTGTRIRWNTDAHDNFGWPIYLAYCNYDVSLIPGVRGGAFTRWGAVTAELSYENRLNPFFQNAGACPDQPPFRDVRNRTFRINLAPLARRP